MGGIMSIPLPTGATQQQVFQQYGQQAQNDLNQLAYDGSNFSGATIMGGTTGSYTSVQALQHLQSGEAIDVQGPDGKHHVITSLQQLQQLTAQDWAATYGNGTLHQGWQDILGGALPGLSGSR